MAENAANLEVHHLREAVVATLVGPEVESVFDSQQTQALGEALYSLVPRQPGQRLIVDLGAVRFASTDFLAKLISLNSRVGRAGGRLTVCGLQPEVQQALHLLRVLPLFEQAGSVDAALGLAGHDAHRTTADFPVQP